MPLVFEDQPRILVKMENRVGEFRIVVVGRQQYETPAHPQMRQQRPAVVEVNEYVLAPAMDMVYPAFPQMSSESGWRRIGREAGPPQFSRYYPASADGFL